MRPMARGMNDGITRWRYFVCSGGSIASSTAGLSVEPGGTMPPALENVGQSRFICSTSSWVVTTQHDPSDHHHTGACSAHTPEADCPYP